MIKKTIRNNPVCFNPDNFIFWKNECIVKKGDYVVWEKLYPSIKNRVKGKVYQVIDTYSFNSVIKIIDETNKQNCYSIKKPITGENTRDFYIITKYHLLHPEYTPLKWEKSKVVALSFKIIIV